MSFKPSPYQERIFDFVANGKGNAIVEAVAGSGKTTTIVEALKRAKGSTVFLAFNKSIAEELKKRGVNARTFHSLCYSPVLNTRSAHKVDAGKLHEIVTSKWDRDMQKAYGPFCKKLVALAKNSGIGCLVEDHENNWLEIIEHHDLELDTECSIKKAIELSRELLAISNRAPDLDFDDLLYLAVKEYIALPKFDFVFVDEAQDTNAIQRAILKKIMKPTSRLIAVGDPAQAIYGFRGADSNSLDLIAREFSCVRLPLTVSYRCSKAVVGYVHQWVTHIEYHENAREGAVVSCGEEWNLSQFEPNDLVVCRTTKPIIALGYRLLRAKKPFYILGREIGQGIKSLINKLCAENLRELSRNLDIWKLNEMRKAFEKHDEKKAQAAEDKADSIECLIEGMYPDGTVQDLLDVVDSLFSEKANATKLATIHKSKGLEAKNVHWLNRDTCPAAWAKQPWQQEQEINLCYVAATRAIENLFLIEEKR